jgi:hypothetical protein
MHGLLWNRVTVGEISVSPEWQTSIAKLGLHNEAHHRMLWKAIDGISDRLMSINVETAHFKGVTAEQRWYGGMGDRPVRDIDLLLAPGHRHRIGDIIEAFQPDHRLRASAQSLFNSGDLQSIDIRFGEDIWIDLHTDVLKMYVPTLEHQLIWDRVVPFTTPSERTVHVLDSESSLIQFLIHLNKDRFALLLGFADVARILQADTLDWGFIDRFARTAGLETIVYSTLEVVTDTLQLPNPGPRPAWGWRRTLWRIVWRPSSRLQGDLGIATGRSRQAWLPYLIPGRIAEAFYRWLRRVFPPRELLYYYYPDLSGAYVLRLFRGRMATQISRRRSRKSLQ